MEVWIIILLLVVLACVFLLHGAHMAFLKSIAESVEILVRKTRSP